MKPTLVIISLLFALPTWLFAGNEDDVASPTEGVIDHRFFGEQSIKRSCMDMLCRFMEYGKAIYTNAGTNQRGDSCGYFKAHSAGKSNEDGVRTNADMAMVAAFVWKYGKDYNIALPRGISRNELHSMACRALMYALSTHRCNRLMACTDGRYWGSDTNHHQWESSLWVMSVALAAHFLGQTDGQQGDMLRRLVAAEADFELTREVPTGFEGDTKAEENGWESNVLACACALLPDHEHAAKWREAMLRYAFNSYTVAADANNETMVTGRKASEWYVGQNLYDDYTLQNHNYFHTSYQNAVMQELAETMVVLRLMGTLKPEEVSLFTWHWKEVWDEVMAPLALCDGELAMPNGNDWSMFLYDQVPAYAAMATILLHPDALMLENVALKYVSARQSTTADGAWMLNSDIGPRRMGVTAHRVMMTYLLHDLFPSISIWPTRWGAFRQRQAATKLLQCQNVVRSMSKERFVCFSWSEGLKNVNCLMVPNLPDKNKIIVPYKKGIGGNMIGHPTGFQLDGKPQFELKKDTWKASGQLRKGNDVMRFGITDCGGNKVQLDYEGADSTIGMMAVSTDPLTKVRRTLYYEGGCVTSDGKLPRRFSSSWVNIDNQIGIICLQTDNQMWFGGRKEVNSIYTSLLYPCRNNTAAHKGTILYFVNQTAEQTQKMWAKYKRKMK